MILNIDQIKQIINNYQIKLNKSMQKVQKKERMANELKIIQNNQNQNYFWTVIQSNDSQWKIQVNCDMSYPYNGPPFHLLVKFPGNYPYRKATITVIQKDKIYHPNIEFGTGKICQQVVKQDDCTIMIKDRIDEFMVFLKQPNPVSCLNPQAGQLYKKDRKQYHRKALSIYRGD